VIDDGSTADSVARLQSLAPRLRGACAFTAMASTAAQRRVQHRLSLVSGVRCIIRRR